MFFIFNNLYRVISVKKTMLIIIDYIMSNMNLLAAEILLIMLTILCPIFFQTFFAIYVMRLKKKVKIKR